MSEKLTKLKKRQQQLNARIVNMQQREKKEARKKRTRELIQKGGLAEIAGLIEMDEGALLGGLFFLRAMIDDDPKRVRQWKQSGDALLAQRKADRDARRKTKKVKS